MTPFQTGGAAHHIQGLVNALLAAGHEVDLIRLPFKFEPEADVMRSMEYASALDMSRPNGIKVDRVISLQFPAWGIQHPDHWVWVMHQHRAVYELYDGLPYSRERELLREKVIEFDNRHLGSAVKVFANSQRVAERMLRFNDIQSKPLYHPPAFADKFHLGAALDYVFFPSRLETLKRQSLLIKAAARMRSSLKILVAGSGGQQYALQQMINEGNLNHKVRLLGALTEEQKIVFYANCLAVAFPPFDEDYGYVTLEAMLSSKPVLTCTDSGGPLEFVRHEENGWICEPDPVAIAERLDWMAAHREQVGQAGLRARESMALQNLRWDDVVEQLTAAS